MQYGGISLGLYWDNGKYNGNYRGYRDYNIGFGLYWVAVKELNLSYYMGETLLFTIYIPIMVT